MTKPAPQKNESQRQAPNGKPDVSVREAERPSPAGRPHSKDPFDNLFIFEMANNHQGSVEHGLRIIAEMGKIARLHGLHAGIKLQYRDLDTFIHPAHKEDRSIKHIPRFLSTRLTANQFLTLIQAIKEEGLASVCTPFDERSVDLCLDHGVEILKVASCSANDWPLLEKVAQSRRPVICSTGGISLSQIDNLASFLMHREAHFALMHCVGLYPAPNGAICANFIAKLSRRFPQIPIGYSGHEAPDNLDVVKVAVAKGARILERHVGLEADGVSLNAYSMNPKQTQAWVGSALEARSICGPVDDKIISQQEIDSLRSLMRGAYAGSSLSQGSVLKRQSLYFAMPCQPGQTSAFDYHETMTASRDYAANAPIQERREVRGKIDMIRGIIHEVKGLLHEANVVIGPDFQIELSHHYGIEQFRRYGAVLITAVNRAYCKKILVVLPGQNHPTHQHKIKEETFQILWGELDITINDKQYVTLKAGDSLLVEPGTRHSFRSANGAIVEEISTAHIVGDSYYDDEDIRKKDPMERKTILEW
jgi:N-acetylneuraminate synthase